MIKVPVVESCPYTVAGTGVMRIAHPVLAILAGAVYDKDEWIALLVGTRSENGLDIAVNSLRVPLQERGHANCELARPEPLTPDVVGVIHSHHNMGAFFSQTDHSTLNPRFPSSLVVARVKTNSSETEGLLGFSYKAEGRAVLPCGSPGVVNFIVQPNPLPYPEWTAIAQGFREPDINTSLYHCPHVTQTNEKFVTHCNTTCGIQVDTPATAIFGKDSQAFIAEVQEKTEKPKWNKWDKWNKGSNNGNGVTVVDNRQFNRYSEYFDDERYLRHWGL